MPLEHKKSQHGNGLFNILSHTFAAPYILPLHILHIFEGLLIHNEPREGESFLLFTAMSYNIVCMPEKWSLPGGEYRRIIVKDHLKIKKGQE